MTRCKHDWKLNPDNSKRVICKICDKEQFVARLRGEVKQKFRRLAEQVEKMPVIEAIDPPVELPPLDFQPVDLLLWVGKEHYSPEEFIKEVKDLGVCRRVQFAPLGVVVGESRGFLAHRDAIKTDEGTSPGIFAYFTIEGVSKIVAPGDEVLSHELKVRGVKIHELFKGTFGTQDERKCGNLKQGGIYLLSEQNVRMMELIAKDNSDSNSIVVFDQPIPIEAKSSRTYRYVSGERIFDRDPENTWYEEAHLVFRENEKTVWRWRDRVKKILAEQEKK